MHAEKVLTPVTETRDGLCEKHGAFTQTGRFLELFKRTFWDDCPKCVEAREQENRIAEERAAKQREEEAHFKRLSGAGIPRRFFDKRFADYQVTPANDFAFRVCKRFADNFNERRSVGGCIVMCGQPGTGKTHLAIAIVHELLEKQYEPLYISTNAAIRIVRSAYDSDSDMSEAQAMSILTNPDLLILDEVGLQKDGDSHDKRLIFDIVDARYADMLPTILISNLSADELGKFIGTRVISRMQENGGVLLPFGWEDYRSTVKHIGGSNA